MSAPGPALIDPFNRRIEYLRVSVTDRCDLRCVYCIPEGFTDFEEPADWLTFDELERLLGTFARLGVSRIRFTGGEPLLRRNLPELASRITRLPGIRDLSLSSNATQLEKHAQALKQAGVSRLNISLDSLDPERIKAINGRDAHRRIMAGIEAARQAGFDPIKINMVAMAGVNDDEIDAMVDYCISNGFILRLIETMPMGETGRNASYLDLQPVRERLKSRFGLLDAQLTGGGPARYLRSPDGKFSVGFITPISQHFCDSCNRVRLSVDGTLYLCLGQDHSFNFRSLLRSQVSDAELEAAVLHAISLKPHKHEFRDEPHKVVRFMSMTGG